MHGPLIATLLVDLVHRERPDATLASFAFRAVRPTFDGEPFTLCGEPSDDGRTIEQGEGSRRLADDAGHRDACVTAFVPVIRVRQKPYAGDRCRTRQAGRMRTRPAPTFVGKPCKLLAGRVPFAEPGDARPALPLPRSASGARILATYIVFTRESMQDQQEFDLYQSKVGATLAGHPVKVLAAYGPQETLEGEGRKAS